MISATVLYDSKAGKYKAAIFSDGTFVETLIEDNFSEIMVMVGTYYIWSDIHPLIITMQPNGNDGETKK